MLAIMFVVGLGVSFLEAWVASKLWGWFLAPSVGLSLPYAAWVGVVFLLSVMRHTPAAEWTAMKNTDTDTLAGRALLKGFAALLVLGIAFLAHRVMS